jgi:FkbM family methyltransferase
MGFSFRRFILAALSRKEAGVSQLEWKYLRFSYAGDGDDIVVKSLLPEPNGFYVDVGAFHPVTISNTYLLYRRGWNGIAIDADPAVARLFKKKRPRDIMVQCAVDEEEGEAQFNVTYAGVSSHIVGTGVGESRNEKFRATITVPRRRLDSIFQEHVPAGRTIDYLTVDCEGNDFKVLRSNDWDRYRPRLITVEDWQNDKESEIYAFLTSRGYKQVFTTANNRFFSLAGN